MNQDASLPLLKFFLKTRPSVFQLSPIKEEDAGVLVFKKLSKPLHCFVLNQFPDHHGVMTIYTSSGYAPMYLNVIVSLIVSVSWGQGRGLGLCFFTELVWCLINNLHNDHTGPFRPWNR